MRFLRWIPLLGPLADCGLQDHIEAFRQTFITLLLSTTPIWLATILVYSMGESTQYSAFRSAFLSTIGSGELFMYCTALLAPLFWLALDDPPGAGAFPSKGSHMVLIAVINLIAASFFAVGVTGRHLNPYLTFKFSTYLFYLSILLLYLGTVYHESRLPASEVFKEQEQDFSSRVKVHRLGGRQ